MSERSGIPLEAIWLRTGERQMAERVGARAGDASDADAAIVAQQVRTIGAEAPEGWKPVDAGGSPEATVEKVRGILGVQAH
jgi:hypothetical protein